MTNIPIRATQASLGSLGLVSTKFFAQYKYIKKQITAAYGAIFLNFLYPTVPWTIINDDYIEIDYLDIDCFNYQ